MKFKVLLLLFPGLFSISKSMPNIFIGLNPSYIKVHNREVYPDLKMNMLTGLNFGMELPIGLFRVGGGYIQRGLNVYSEIGNLKETYNYINVYGILCVPIKTRINIVVGIQYGNPISGKSKFKGSSYSETVDIDQEDINSDYGYVIGYESLQNSGYGFRLTYYRGLTSVSKVLEHDLNYQNRGVSISLIYEISNIR